MTINDLKMAIQAHTGIAQDDWAEQAGGAAHAAKKLNALAEAWRTAFEWREAWHKRLEHFDAEGGLRTVRDEIVAEGIEGMALIGEKLK
jgi:hypothetical protein